MNYYVKRPESMIDKFFEDFRQPTNLGRHLDIYKKDNAYYLELDLPGFKKEEIAIDFKEDVLTIEAKHVEEEKSEENKEYIYQSRRSNDMKRQIRFSGIDVDKVEASFESGVLKMTLPLEQESVPETKQIELK